MPGDVTDTYAADKLDPALIDGSGDPKHQHHVHVHDHELPPKYNGEVVAQSEYFDRGTSVIFGRPLGIHPDETNTPMPVPYPDPAREIASSHFYLSHAVGQ